MAYDLDFKEEADIQYHIKKFLLYPTFWNNHLGKPNIKLSWRKVNFSATNRNKIPDVKGVYAFVLTPKVQEFFETKYLFYVGKTNRSLNIRYNEYLNEKAGKGKPRKKIFKMLNLYDGSLTFYYSEINDKKNVDKFEEYFLNTFVPHVNTIIPKAKIKRELLNIYEQ